MKKSLIVIVSLCVLAITGCSKDEKTQQIINPQDAAFIHKATLANSAEILLGQLAADSSTNQAIKDFGEMMVAEHSASAAALEALASRLGIATPDTVESKKLVLMTELKLIKGDRFDSLYIYNQVTDHYQTLNLYENAHGLGNNIQVKSYISEYVPHLQEHLSLAIPLAAVY